MDIEKWNEIKISLNLEVLNKKNGVKLYLVESVDVYGLSSIVVTANLAR